MNMSRYDKPPSGNTVDWSNPELQSLLTRS
jgi:hypothetical protein